jgi:hypothetical protein
MKKSELKEIIREVLEEIEALNIEQKTKY